MGKALETRYITIDNLNRLIWDYEGANNRPPSLIIMKFETFHYFVLEIQSLYGMYDSYRIWQGIKIIRSNDIDEGIELY